jgi:hypothetical protein
MLNDNGRKSMISVMIFSINIYIVYYSILNIKFIKLKWWWRFRLSLKESLSAIELSLKEGINVM